MAVARKGTFTSHDGTTVVTLDHYAAVFLNGESFARTVRTTSCELLVHGVKCDSCKTYRAATLQTRYTIVGVINVLSKSVIQLAMQTKDIHEDTWKNPSLAKGLMLLNMKYESYSRKSNSWLRSMEKKSILAYTCRPSKHNAWEHRWDWESISKRNFRRLFWEKQFRAACAKDPHQVYWHPLIIHGAWAWSCYQVQPIMAHELQGLLGYLRKNLARLYTLLQEPDRLSAGSQPATPETS